MSIRSTLVETGTNRLFNVDCEYMSSAHWGFDAAYFLSSLRKMRDPEEHVQAIEDIALGEDRVGDGRVQSFFRLYASILSDVSQHSFRPARIG